jgi:hypothetical protein
MKKNKILLLPFLVFLMISLACEFSPFPEKKKIVESVSFPAKYTDKVAIKTWNECDTQASAVFTAFVDNTCVLEVTYPNAYQNFEGLTPGDAGYGACKPAGDTQGWYIYGNFDESSHVCAFTYCNDKTNYYAEGSLSFDSTLAYTSEGIECFVRDDGKRQIAVTRAKLYPATP